ncbi:MAG: prepilin-type N-terminal cleavage/methylation domain-containing protein [Acidobacteriia bacterium]|nr:prepilin-type N-terminal cleavage/methylation domain-containing protein [Terriglobia bacterium]
MTVVREAHNHQAGFSLVETMIATIILGGGLLALATAFAQGMVSMSTSHYHQIAKEKASEAIESVFTSRDTRTIIWARIRNVNNGGIFLDGPQPLLTPGPDGLANTTDDGPAQTEILPGPDGVLGTGDDIVFLLNSFTREMVITDLAPNLRQIRVIVRYQIGHLSRQYQLIAYISSFA